MIKKTLKPLLSILFIIMTFTACEEDILDNLSHIHHTATDDFRISSITPVGNGSIWCLGKEGAFGDTLIARKYDKTFKLIKQVNLTVLKGFDEGTIIKPDQNGGWLVAHIIQGAAVNIEVQVLSEEFEIVESNIVKDLHPALYDGILFSGIARLSNGDIVLCYNRARTSKEYVILLNSGLEPKWDVTLKDKIGIKSEFHEIDNGQLMLAHFIQRDRGFTGPGGSFFFGAIPLDCQVTQMDNDGNIVMESVYKPESHHTSPIGISRSSTGFIFNFITNDEHIQQYVAMSFDGQEIEHKQLGFNYINHQIINGFEYGHFPLGEANPLPIELKPNQGHLIYSEVDKKLQFLEVGPNAELIWRFPIHLPEFDELLSYRQLFTDHGTMIIGVSYVYAGKEFFNLQELTMDGEVVQ